MITENEKIDRLVNTAIFESVPEEQLSEIANVLKSEKVPAKKILFQKGDPGGCFYIILSGKLRVFLKGEENVETHLNWLGPGDSFGEMALLTDEPRSTDVETTEDTHLLVLPKDEFDEILRKYPDIYKNFIKHVTKLLKRDENRMLEETEREHKIAKLSIFDFVFIGIVVIFFATVFNLSNPNKINVLPEIYDAKDFPRITVNEAKKEYDDARTIFVDARPANFFDKEHIKGAINLPLPSFEIAYMYMSDKDKEKNIIIYGRSIGALYDEAVARQLALYGHENIKLLRGTKQFLPLRWFALDNWIDSGYPVEGYSYE